MARVICVKPCVQAALNITVPFVGTATSVGSISFKADCAGCDMVSNMFTQLGPTIASLGMPLCLMSCVASVVQFAQAVPDSLGPPPDPMKLVTAIENVVTQCQCVVNMTLPPPAGVVCQLLKMVGDSLTAITQMLVCVNALLDHLLLLSSKALTALTDVNVSFRAVGTCLQQEVAQHLLNLLNKFNTISTIFDMMAPVFSVINSITGNAVPQLNDIATAFATFQSATSGNPSIDVVQSACNELASDLAPVAAAITDVAMVCP